MASRMPEPGSDRFNDSLGKGSGKDGLTKRHWLWWHASMLA